MTCSDISKSAPLYHAGELEPAQAAAFTAHLSSCPECRRALARDAELDDLVRRTVLNDDVDASTLDGRVRAGIRAGRQKSRRWLIAGAGIAALLAVAYSVTVSRTRNPVYAAAARDHRMELVQRQPRKWFTDRVVMEGLAPRAGVSSAAVAAFAPAGYRLAKGKLCLLDGRLFLHLVYTGDNGDFSLFLRRRDGGPGSDTIHQNRFASETVAAFQDGQLNAMLVTDQSAATALRLAQSAAAIL